MELKEQIKGELLKQKEEKLKKEKEINSKLKEITLYTKSDNPLSKNYKEFYNKQGIKFQEKDLNLHNEIVATVQLNAFPIIFINPSI